MRTGAISSGMKLSAATSGCTGWPPGSMSIPRNSAACSAAGNRYRTMWRIAWSRRLSARTGTKPVARTPPPKRAGHATGRRRFDGEVLDVAAGAAFLGTTEKAVRARVARRLLPHRRLNGRVVMLRGELLAFLDALPGISTVQALANIAQREGRPE